MAVTMKIILTLSSILLVLALYTLIGTCGDVNKIKELSPHQMELRNWKILRYEGFQYGSWRYHGGKVWYHVADRDNPAIQYRVFVTLWNNELQFYYEQPEILQRIELNYSVK